MPSSMPHIPYIEKLFIDDCCYLYMANEQNPLLQKLKEHAAIDFLGIDLNSESLEKRIEQKMSEINARRARAIESFYSRYPYSEPGDIGGFEEGDLLRYQSTLDNYDKNRGLFESLLKIIGKASPR